MPRRRARLGLASCFRPKFPSPRKMGPPRMSPWGARCSSSCLPSIGGGRPFRGSCGRGSTNGRSPRCSR
eukprot:4929546-Lingulodinium_polyedra.AAC.1